MLAPKAKYQRGAEGEAREDAAHSVLAAEGFMKDPD
jgi:hypothetical protein